MSQPKLNPKPNLPVKKNNKHQLTHNQKKTMEEQILDELKKYKNFAAYPIRTLVKHSEEFGRLLKKKKLETNQIRKFLDAINRIKVNVTKAVAEKNHTPENVFKMIEAEIVLLKPKLAYAAARKDAAQSLNKVMSKVIDKIHSLNDFERLVQFIESIIAYHKSAGGK